MKGFSAYIDPGFPGRGYKLYFWRPIVDYERERAEVLKSPEIVEVSGMADFPSDCGIILHKAEAQSLMDQLWRVGIRPTEGHGSTGQIGAVQEHLKAVSATHERLLSMVEKKWGV